MPVLATYFNVRRGRDPFFKFYMKTLFPRHVREYGEKYGIKLIGWYNVAHGWDFDNPRRDGEGRGHPGDRPSGLGMDDGAPPHDVPPRADGT